MLSPQFHVAVWVSSESSLTVSLAVICVFTGTGLVGAEMAPSVAGSVSSIHPAGEDQVITSCEGVVVPRSENIAPLLKLFPTRTSVIV